MNTNEFEIGKIITLNLDNGNEAKAKITLVLDLFGDSIIIYEHDDLYFFAKINEDNSLEELDEPTYKIVEEIFMKYLEDEENTDLDSLIKEYKEKPE